MIETQSKTLSALRQPICTLGITILFFLGAWAQVADERVVTAVWTETPIELDGRLDEPQWSLALPATGFIQNSPRDQEPATGRTVVRVLFDEENLYFGVYCYQDPSRIVISDLGRDFGVTENDVFGIGLDTRHDHRNGFVFFTNPGEAKEDAQVASDGLEFTRDWDGIWDVVTQVQEDGWTVEIVIPFKTVGYNSQDHPIMGINFKRRIRHKNEDAHWGYIPRRFLLSRFSLAGRLVDLRDIPRSQNLRVKPFLSGTFTQRDLGTQEDNNLDGEAGLDVKYRLSEGLTLDLTLNTDFSQVEVDTQQINLTRFSLFFPEKRDFFLENATLFAFGDVPTERGPRSRSQETQLFYSRRIGLSPAGRALPLLGGARLSGRVGKFSLGILNIHQQETDDFASNNFTVTRLRRDILSRSEIGAIFINREGGEAGDYNRTYGLDLNMQLRQEFTINGFIAATQSPELDGENVHTKISSKWEDAFWYTQGLFADIGENFNPQVGFVPRRGIRNYQYDLGFKPRTEGDAYIREFQPNYSIKYFTDRDNRTLTKEGHYGMQILFRDGSRFGVNYDTHFERLLTPFRIHPTVTIPVGDYFFNDWGLQYSSDRSQLLFGSLLMFRGDFYDGTKTSARLGGGLALRPNLLTELTYEYNSVNVQAGDFRADLYGLRFNYSFNPKVFFDAFIQYNESTGKVLTNLRFNWEHRPLSYFSVVLTEDRLTGSSIDLFRALIFKYTHLLQF